MVMVTNLVFKSGCITYFALMVIFLQFTVNSIFNFAFIGVALYGVDSTHDFRAYEKYLALAHTLEHH